MQSQNRIFDDLARVAGGALSALGSLKEEIDAMVKSRFDSFAENANLVSREEFEVVRDMAAAARAEQERLTEKVAELEAKLAAAPAKKPAPKAKPAARRTSTASKAKPKTPKS